MTDSERLLEAVNKNTAVVERFLATSQDQFILLCLQGGMGVHSIKGLLGVSTDRVTRVSKIQKKAARFQKKTKKDDEQ